MTANAREELIESVANILADYDGDDIGTSPLILSTTLAALREPADGMQEAGVKARWRSSVRDADNVREIWQHMLSASPLAPSSKGGE